MIENIREPLSLCCEKWTDKLAQLATDKNVLWKYVQSIPFEFLDVSSLFDSILCIQSGQ